MVRARSRRRRRGERRSGPAGRELFAIGTVVSLFAAIVLWETMPGGIRTPPQPVAAHSTPSVAGTCAVHRSDGAVWGRIIRVGSSRGVMDRYVVETLTQPARITEVSMAEARSVPCGEVTGIPPF